MLSVLLVTEGDARERTEVAVNSPGRGMGARPGGADAGEVKEHT